jgi:hypothetical protein
MIVDTGADLNVYLETGQDGERKGSCCAPEAGTGCGDSAEATVPPAAADNGCSASAGVVSEKTDLNEFVGQSTLGMWCLRALADFDFGRLVQDLCCEEMRVPASTSRGNGKGHPGSDRRNRNRGHVVKTRQQLLNGFDIMLAWGSPPARFDYHNRQGLYSPTIITIPPIIVREPTLTRQRQTVTDQASRLRHQRGLSRGSWAP